MDSSISITKTSIDGELDKCCNSKGQEDWGLIMQLSDKIGASTKTTDSTSKAIVKRIGGNTNANSAYLAVVLLDACFNNCGETFQTSVAKPVIIKEFKRLLQLASATPVKVVNKLKEALQGRCTDAI